MISIKLRMKTSVVVIIVCLAILLQLGVCYSIPPNTGEIKINVQAITDFVDKVLEYIKEFKAYNNKDFVCSAKLQELLDLLDVQDDQDGAVKAAKKNFCSDDW